MFPTGITVQKLAATQGTSNGAPPVPTDDLTDNSGNTLQDNSGNTLEDAE